MSRQKNICCSAPGSLIVLGEYAVLHGSPAVVAAMDKRIHVHIRHCHSNDIHIKSLLGSFTGSLEALEHVPELSYVFASISVASPQIKGIEICINSDFSSLWGLGSSAAITSATLAALHLFMHGDQPSDQTLFKQAMDVLKLLNKKGSGADMAASIFGGIIKYCNNHTSLLPKIPNLFVIYTGNKASTDQAIQRTAMTPQLLAKIDESTLHGIKAILASDWDSLAKVMNQQHQYLVALGTQTPAISFIIQSQHLSPSIAGIKISGAGFGDCLIGLSHKNTLLPSLDKHLNAFYLKSTITTQGVIYEQT